MTRRTTLTQRILQYYEERAPQDIPAELAARDLKADPKVLASILSRLAREEAVVRVSRGIYRVPGVARGTGDLGDVAEGLRLLIGRTFGATVATRLALDIPAEADLGQLRVFYRRLESYVGRQAADDLVKKIATQALGEGEALFLGRRLREDT